MGDSPTNIGLRIYNGRSGAIMAGSTVYGRIYLSNTRWTNAQSIRLRLIGTELTEVYKPPPPSTQSSLDGSQRMHGGHRRHGNDDLSRARHGERTNHDLDSSRETYVRDANKFFEIEHTIKTFPNMQIPRGQFEFPFAVPLPASLPSSMRAEKDKSSCEVLYQVIAEVFRKHDSPFYQNERAKQTLYVVAMQDNRIASNDDPWFHFPPEVIPINGCCCFQKSGTMALEAKFEKSNLFMDTPAPLVTYESGKNRQQAAFRTNDRSKNIGIEFRVENKSSLEVTKVYADLKQTIEWEAKGQRISFTTTLGSTKMDGSLFKELNAASQGQEHAKTTIEDRDWLLAKQSWRTMDPPLHIRKVSMANDSYEGRKIKVRHVLLFMIDTEGMCATKPSFSDRVYVSRDPSVFPAEEVSWETMFAAMAPPGGYNNLDDFGLNFVSAAAGAMGAAQMVLPQNWQAELGDLVTIPIAGATVVPGRR